MKTTALPCLIVLLATAGLFACDAVTPAAPATDPNAAAASPPPPIPPLGPALPAGFPMSEPKLAADSLRVTAPAPAGATDWYVDATGGSDSATGKSAAAAWKSLDKLHSAVLKPGDVIHLARGSVWENQMLLLDQGYSGTAGNPITFQAYGTGLAPTISKPRALWDKSKEFDAISVSGGSSFIRILDIKVQETALCSGVSLGINTHDIVVAGCEVWRCNTGVSLAGTKQKILGNFIHDIGSAGGTSGIGIGFVGKDLEMGWNRLENCQARSTVGDLGVDGGAFEFYNYRSDVGYNYLSENIRIHHNVICACLNFMEAYGNVSGMKIDFNVYLNGPNEALEFHYDDSEHAVWTITPSYDLVEIANNTFVPNATDRKVGWGIIGLLVDWVPAHDPVPAQNRMTLRNNLFVTNYRVVAYKNVLGASLTHDHNIYWMLDGARPSNDAAYALGATDKLYDATHPGTPGLANRAGSDFRPAAGSAAINAGATATDTLDILRTVVPSGGAPDIGAYEYF